MDNQPVPIEPRAATIADLLVIVVSFALIWGWCALLGPLTASTLITSALVGIPTSIAFVVFVRLHRYERSVHRAEIMVLMAALYAIFIYVPNVDTTINWVHETVFDAPLRNYSLWRWGLATVLTLISLPLIAGAIQRKPNAIGSAMIWLIVGLFLWGPLRVFELHFDFLFYFLQISPPITPLEVWMFEFQNVVRLFPGLMIELLPIALCILSWRRDRKTWNWICWASMLFAVLSLVMIVLAQMVNLYGESGVWRHAWIARPTFLVLFAFGIHWLGRRIPFQRILHSPPLQQ